MAGGKRASDAGGEAMKRYLARVRAGYAGRDGGFGPGGGLTDELMGYTVSAVDPGDV